MVDKNVVSTYQEVFKWASCFLGKHDVDPLVAKWLMRERFHLSLTEWVCLQHTPMPKHMIQQYRSDIIQAANHYPPQYIVGHEWFMGRKFHVTEHTLIPRPETEEWCQHYLSLLPSHSLTVVDVGTGSGVLGITHKLSRPHDTVYITDIIPKTLAVATKNATRLKASVHCLLGDLVQPVIDKKIKADLLITNPPYIGENEWNEMDVSVRRYEPKSALFAKEDGFYMYDQLAKNACHVLSPNGQIIAEIGYKQADKVSQLWRKYYPQAQIEIWTDFNGLDRVVHMVLNGDSLQ